MDRRSSFGCVRSAVCVQIGWRGREWGVLWRLLQEGVWTVKTVESEVRRTRHEGAEKDGDSGVLGMWYEHEYTRGWSRLIVVFAVFFVFVLFCFVITIRGPFQMLILYT